ncbi:hypothetical protein NQ038_00930 [Brevibacterium sp. 50QC2O2]|jgi:secretion/DNA translocation related CpaE-like protein|uniref:septum site-determining protein Ssd n=1 Tax=Brevibacterium TaxID=1696 RepID=UPI00211C6A8F|nr:MULTISPECIES: septum site-determining protein Ssd [unclassified Brevibacterium]MCQ9368612.1 hypothetical protein [Brevibacterium sp. 91QC2O2]MCQ9385341.1 hypothetical protein [Brevibacterium sp. 68QC2CO]MCQ9387220.1 hypothetical protein [Brevibacterium sp. 50QC2O2]
MSRIVLFSQLTSLSEHCAALADGIGLSLDVRAPDAGGWQDAVLVLLGEDVAVRPAISGPATVLVSLSPASATWVLAAKLGVDHVAVLPDAAEWLTQRMIQAVEPARESAPTYGIMAGCGGAGASVLACALARHGAESGLSTVLLDADPLGGGLDLLLGCEDAEGLRWPSLAASRGRLLPSTLTQALPRAGDLAILSWDRHGVDDLAAEVFDTVLSAAQQAFDLVVVDLPRHTPIDRVRACHEVVVVTPARVRAAVAASRVSARLAGVHASVGLVVRQTGRAGLDPQVVAQTMGLDLLGTLRDDPQLAAGVDRGDGLPGSRTHLGRLAQDLLGRVTGA